MIMGPAFTVKYRDRDESGGTVGDYIDDVPPGSVVVISNRGRTDCTVWGDLLTRTSRHMGISGTVIDGAFRDVEVAEAVSYPIYAKASFMVTGKDRVVMDATTVPLVIENVVVNPGDIVCGDRSGVVVVPQEVSAQVFEVAATIAEAEAKIADLVESGERLDRARAALGYHALQKQGSGGGT